MYHLYHTPAFVLGGTSFGEANKHFTLFTRELGMITASATSVRAERSKLRYGLQDFSLSDITLVRGRERWRITNATLVEDVFRAFRHSPEATALFARVFRLLRRLLSGEEKNEPLFTTLVYAFSFLQTPEAASGEHANTEIILVLRILYLLGYLAPRTEFSPFISDLLLWDAALVKRAGKLRALALADINHSLRQTQL